MEKNSRIYVAGHTGLVGSGLCRVLAAQGFSHVITRTHRELELTDRVAVKRFFDQAKPEYVFLAAGLAGGIARNRAHGAELIYANLAIQNNVIDLAHRSGVAKLLFLGSACAYPRECPQPIAPSAMLTGPLEPTNEPFALAKLAGIGLCRAYNRQYGTHFLTVIPATVYGPNDHFDENGHVVASLIARFHAAKTDGLGEVVVWGTGRPRREFMYVDDLAEGLVFLMQKYDQNELINLGVGQDVSIADLAAQIARTVGFGGKIIFDTAKPDGMPARLLDSRPVEQLGWRSHTTLAEGLARTYEWFLQNRAKGRP
jgi:GDP-L-fucose synthase